MPISDPRLSSVKRHPHLSLRPFVRTLWSSVLDGTGAVIGREHVIPTGDMHLVFRLDGPGVRIFADDEDQRGEWLGQSVVGGPRASFYVKDVPGAGRTVGVSLHPAASFALFGANAAALSDAHVSLDALWPAARVTALRDQLLETPDPARQIDVLEQALSALLPRALDVHPAVAIALQRLGVSDEACDILKPIDDRVWRIARDAGYSHRTFIARFREAMGVTPKAYARVQRIRRALARIHDRRWSALALEVGFSDQAHFSRDFRAMTGVTPSAYRHARPESPHHVKILQDGIDPRR